MSHPDVPHLDLDALCDVLDGAANSEQTAHASSCPQCRAALAELHDAQASVTATLRALPDPPVPASVIARLDAALAAERAPKVATATVTPLGAAPSRRTAWLPWAGGVAAAAALVVGLVSLRSGASPSSSSQDGAARTESRLQLPTSSTGNHYSAKGDLLARTLPQLLSGSSAKGAAPEVAAGAPGRTTGSTAPGPVTAAGTDPLAALRDQAVLARCLAGLTDPSDASLPLALDYAAFDGQPALVVVYPTNKPRKVDVFVVGAACSQADSKLLFFTRLTRP